MSNPEGTQVTPIRFRFDEVRTTEAASLLLKWGGGKMTRLRLIKLLYFADRDCILKFGHPICGGKYVSMKHGPVLSDLYNIITNNLWTESQGFWEEHFANSGPRDIELIREPKPQKLSRAQISALQGVFERLKDLSDWQIRDLGHELPEYEDPGKSSLPIPVKRILTVEGKSEQQIKDVAEDASALSCADKFLAK